MKKFYASDFSGLEITEFNTRAEAASFVLKKKGRRMLDIPTCLGCGSALMHQVQSHITDREFYYTCLNDHMCNSDGVPLTDEEILARNEWMADYDGY